MPHLSSRFDHRSLDPFCPRSVSSMKQRPKALLKFSAILEASADGSLPYPALKRLLRCLKASHPAYPKRVYVPNAPIICSLSQTQEQAEKRIGEGVLAQGDSVDGGERGVEDSRYLLDLAQGVEEPHALSQSTERTISQKCCLTPVDSAKNENSSLSISQEEQEIESAAGICTISEYQLSPPSQKREWLTSHAACHHEHKGTVVNETLWKLVSDSGVESITWGQLRQRLIAISDEFEIFCDKMDAHFEQYDVVATTKLDEPCVFYSSVFWESASRGYYY